MLRTIGCIVMLGVAVVCAQAGASIANPSAEPVPGLERAQKSIADITSVEEYLQFRQDQVQKFEAGEFGQPSRRDRTQLRSAMQQMSLLLEGRTSVRELTPRDQVALFNAQEQIDALIEDYSDPVVCRRERRLGSQFPQNICQRRSEIEAQREAGREFALDRPLPPPPPCDVPPCPR